MKCPKCGYLGFERVDRCRNCGYDFSLSAASDPAELPLRAARAADPGPLPDLTLGEGDRSLALKGPVRSPEMTAVAAGRAETIPELPLFELPAVLGVGGADDVPLITRPSPPRTPLAVRRATPEVARLRTEVRSPLLDLDVADGEPPIPRTIGLRQRARAETDSPSPASTVSVKSASVVARVFATGIDVVLLAAIDAAVVYFTLQICGLTTSDLAMIPKAPLVVFLAIQNLGYFVAFTVGGQTLGQMALGIKVVDDDTQISPDWNRAVVRTVVWAALAAPAGLGLLTALFGREHRGLHDRCARTRVIRAIV